MRKLIDSTWGLVLNLLLSVLVVAIAIGPIRRLNDTTRLFIIGWVLQIALAAVLSKCLPHDYRTRLRPSSWTLMLVWAFSGVNFALLVTAAVRSTWHFSVPAPLALVSGILLIAAGTAICLAGLYAYGGSVMRLNGIKTDRLVTEGIYRWSRNPMTIGWTAVLVGVGLIRGSGMVLALMAFLLFASILYLPVEEELLRQLYGDAYQEYRARTNRYFGRRRVNVTAAWLARNRD